MSVVSKKDEVISGLCAMPALGINSVQNFSFCYQTVNEVVRLILGKLGWRWVEVAQGFV